MKTQDEAIVVKISRSVIAEAALTLLDWLQTLAPPMPAAPPENDGRRRETVYHDDGSRTERTFDEFGRIVREVDWRAQAACHQAGDSCTDGSVNGASGCTMPPGPHAPRQDQAETD